ncbi:MAG: GNAT family N-acetyltransferase [Thermoplasmata archaeon]
MDAPRSAKGAPRTELEELLLSVRKDLVRREESPSGEWVEETARELWTGARPGWYFPASEGGGVAFYARRGAEAYGHVHAGEGTDRVARATRLGDSLLDGLPREIVSANLGFTGIDGADERACAEALGARPGSTVIRRQSMERPLSAADGGAAPPLPEGLEGIPVRDVTVDALADLDRRAFEGTADAFLLGAGLEGYREVLGSMLEGRLGRFVDEASVALVERSPVRLAAAVLTTEQSIRRAVLVDLMVDPERRRHGLGRYLVTWVLRALWALGYESVRLWVTEANTAARGLYGEFGFRSIGDAVIYRWDRTGSPAQAQPGR